ncbi:MAG TPA: extracellular solute-binding protein [Mesotoga sp.]|nr:extracellular solute-binding protein [Mesotoga sp.]
MNALRRLFVLLVLFIGIFLSATTIEVLWMGWPQDQVMQLVKAFKDENPTVEVDIQLVPFGQLFQTLEVRLAAGDGTPDVYIVDGPNTASYAARSYLLALDDYFTDEEMDDWFSASIEEGSYDGKFYSVPYGTSSAGIFYNKAIFEEYGIPFPPEGIDERLTWDEVVEIARALTKDTNNDGITDIWGLVIEQIDRPYLIFPIVQSLGARALSSDGFVSQGYINSKEFIEGTTFYWKLFNEWKISPQGVPDSAIAREYFGTGKAAMMLGNEWNIRRMSQYPSVEFGLTPFPYFEGGAIVTPTGSWHVGINSKTRKLDEALKFTKFITGKEAVITWHMLNGIAPARYDVYEALPEVFGNPMWQTFLYEMEHTAVARPVTPGYSQYELMLREAFNSIHYGADPKKTLDDAAIRIDRELRRYK